MAVNLGAFVLRRIFHLEKAYAALNRSDASGAWRFALETAYAAVNIKNDPRWLYRDLETAYAAVNVSSALSSA